MRGEDILALAGVVVREGTNAGGGMDVKVLMVKVKSLLLFFDGELRSAGSTFSLSKLSKGDGSNARLESTLFDELAGPLPRGDFAIIPDLMSTRKSYGLEKHLPTILAVLCAGQMLEPGVIERSKWHPRHWSVRGHCEYLLDISTRSD